MNINQACRDGNLCWLKQQHAAGTLGDVTDRDNYAVRWAANNGHLDVVKWLVMESGQPVDVTSCNNNTVRSAARNGHLDVVKWLVLESGQTVNVTAYDNYAIQVAAEFGHLDVLRWLVLESGQPVDVTVDGNYALIMAIDNGYTDAANFLTAVTKLHKSGITIEQIQAKPGIVELAKKGMDPAVIISLSETDIDELLSQSSTEKHKQSKIRL